MKIEGMLICNTMMKIKFVSNKKVNVNASTGHQQKWSDFDMHK